jgi:cytochrome c oxidase subunit II
MILSHIVNFLILPVCMAGTDAKVSYGMRFLNPESYQLHRIYFYIGCGITAILMSILLYSLVKLRYSKDMAGPYFHKYLMIDLFWTILPFLILIALVFPAAKLLT